MASKNKHSEYIQIPREEYEDLQNNLSGIFTLMEGMFIAVDISGVPQCLAAAKKLIADEAKKVVLQMKTYSD